jgi:hypothetical protein
MSIQSTFANQSFYPVRNVSAANCTSPIDGEIPGEADGDWTRITDYADSETILFPFDGDKYWTGGFRIFRHDFERAHEVLVYHFSEAHEHMDTHSTLDLWFVHWNGVGFLDADNHLGEIGYHTPSLRDARRIVATLLTNIARADVNQSNWTDGVKSVVDQLDTMSIRDYQKAHADGLDKHTPWCERRAQIHANARLEWQNVREYRQRILQELRVEIASHPGGPVRELLPATVTGEEDLKQQFIDDDLTLDEFEDKIEQSWEKEELVTFDEYLAGF